MDQLSEHKFEEIKPGMGFSFEHRITTAEIDAFAKLSGDFSPIHISDSFAQERGFSGRVVHGFLVGALVSRMVGMHMPGKNAVLQQVQLSFRHPIYSGDALKVTSEVTKVVESVKTIVLNIQVDVLKPDGMPSSSVTGKIQIGFTQ